MANQIKAKRILRVATVCREVIDTTDRSGWYDDFRHFMSDFPSGCCQVTAHALGAFLSTLGLGTFICFRGVLGNTSHAWLEQNGLIVDITARINSPEGQALCSSVVIALGMTGLR